MGLFTITIGQKENNPPSQIGDLSIVLQYPEVYDFVAGDFTDNTNPVYSDPEGDAPNNIKILTLPNGDLTLNGIDITINQEIP